jgi:hypothetical protein
MDESGQGRLTKSLHGMGAKAQSRQSGVATHHADLITAYKIQFGQHTVDKCRIRLFEGNSYTATRSHNYKVIDPFAHSDVR